MSKVYIFIETANTPQTLKILSSVNIDITDIKYLKDGIKCRIDIDDIDYLSKLYNVNILKKYGLPNLYNVLKSNLYHVLVLIFGITLYFFLSQIIVSVKIDHPNKELNSMLYKELKEYGIKRLSLKKDFKELQNIKSSILATHPDTLEWLEIYQNGMTYEIKLEERILTNKEDKNDTCHIIAKKEGIVRAAYSTSGVVLVEKNDYVKPGDILISGEIKLNEEVKGNVCASGVVKAETWYEISVSIPLIYINKEYTGKTRYNFILKDKSGDYRLFKNRIDVYSSEKKSLLNIFDKELILEKQFEYIENENKYSEDEALKKGLEEAKNKLSDTLGENDKILSQKVLKKSINDSTIDLDIFMTVEEDISTEKVYTVTEKEEVLE